MSAYAGAILFYGQAQIHYALGLSSCNRLACAIETRFTVAAKPSFCHEQLCKMESNHAFRSFLHVYTIYNILCFVIYAGLIALAQSHQCATV